MVPQSPPYSAFPPYDFMLQTRNFERHTISPGECGKCVPASERAKTTDVIDRNGSARMQRRNVHDHASSMDVRSRNELQIVLVVRPAIWLCRPSDARNWCFQVSRYHSFRVKLRTHGNSTASRLIRFRSSMEKFWSTGRASWDNDDTAWKSWDLLPRSRTTVL